MKLKALLLTLVVVAPTVNAMTEETFEKVTSEVSEWCSGIGGTYVNGKRGMQCKYVETYVQRGKFLIEEDSTDYKLFVDITNYETGEVSVSAKPITPTSDDYDPKGSKVVHKFFHEGKW